MAETKRLVLKVGGSLVADSKFLTPFSHFVAQLEKAPVIIHGGSRATSALSNRLGLRPRFIDGLRVTDTPTLEIAVMGMVGHTSTSLVRHLVRAGVPALGLSGVDAGLVQVRAHPNKKLGWVGVPAAISKRLSVLIEADFVPCIAPLCLDQLGELRNLNSDPLAGFVAKELGEAVLIYVTASPVLKDGKRVKKLSPKKAAKMIETGVIDAGMKIKVEAAQEALAQGVSEVYITDLKGLKTWGRGKSPSTQVTL